MLIAIAEPISNPAWVEIARDQLEVPVEHLLRVPAVRGRRVHHEVEVGIAARAAHRGQGSDQDVGEVVDRLVGEVAERALVEGRRDPRLERRLRRPGLERHEAADLVDHAHARSPLGLDQLVVDTDPVLVEVARRHVEPPEQPGQEHGRRDDLRVRVREGGPREGPEVLEHDHRANVGARDQRAVALPPHADDPGDLLPRHLVHAPVVARRLDHDLVAPDPGHLAEHRLARAGGGPLPGERGVHVRDDAHLPFRAGRVPQDLGRRLILVAGAEGTARVAFGQLGSRHHDGHVRAILATGGEDRPLTGGRVLSERGHEAGRVAGGGFRRDGASATGPGRGTRSARRARSATPPPRRPAASAPRRCSRSGTRTSSP